MISPAKAKLPGLLSATQATTESSGLPPGHHAAALKVHQDGSSVQLVAMRSVVRASKIALTLEFDERVALRLLRHDVAYDAHICNLSELRKVRDERLFGGLIVEPPNKERLVRVARDLRVS